jgi:hypothetical protein
MPRRLFLVMVVVRMLMLRGGVEGAAAVCSVMEMARPDALLARG